MSTALLSTHELKARYGDFQALYGVDFEIAAGEVVALIGANGAGKSTLLKSIMGLLKVAPDMVRLDGRPVGGSKPHRMVAEGVAIVPEGRRLFAGMSVVDNLRVAIDHAATGRGAAWTIERVYALFPILEEKQTVPVQSLSRFGAPRCSARSFKWTVRKSMLRRVRPDVFGTVECKWAAEKISSPSCGGTIRNWGSSSTGSRAADWRRVSGPTWLIASLRPCSFQWASSNRRTSSRTTA